MGDVVKLAVSGAQGGAGGVHGDLSDVDWLTAMEDCDGAVLYVALRSVRDTEFYLIHFDGRMDDVPMSVRRRGPWQVLRRGPLDELLAPYRRALVRDGHCTIAARLPQYRALPAARAADWRQWHEAVDAAESIRPAPPVTVSHGER